MLHAILYWQCFMLYSIGNASCYTLSAMLHAILYWQCLMLYSIGNASCYTLSAMLHAILYRQCFMLYFISSRDASCYTLSAMPHAILYRQCRPPLMAILYRQCLMLYRYCCVPHANKVGNLRLLRKKVSVKLASFQVREGAEKVQKQGRDERTQEDYPTSAKNTHQM